MTRRGLAGVLAAALLTASCSGDDDTATSVAESVPESTVESVERSVVDGPEQEPTEPEPTESTAPGSTPPESTAPTEDLPAEPILPVPESEVIAQTTPTSGGGARPS